MSLRFSGLIENRVPGPGYPQEMSILTARMPMRRPASWSCSVVVSCRSGVERSDVEGLVNKGLTEGHRGQHRG